MFSHSFVLVPDIYVPQVVYKSVLDSEGGLAHVLHATFFAGNDVDQVGASTGDLCHAGEALASVFTKHTPCFVQEWAISAVLSVAEIVSPGAVCCVA